MRSAGHIDLTGDDDAEHSANDGLEVEAIFARSGPPRTPAYRRCGEGLADPQQTAAGLGQNCVLEQRRISRAIKRPLVVQTKLRRCRPRP